MTFSKFETEWSSNCKKDYLFVGNVSGASEKQPLPNVFREEKLIQLIILRQVLVNPENLIHFLKVAKYNKLYLCGSKLPTNLSLKSKARTMVDPFRHLPS